MLDVYLYLQKYADSLSGIVKAFVVIFYETLYFQLGVLFRALYNAL